MMIPKSSLITRKGRSNSDDSSKKVSCGLVNLQGFLEKCLVEKTFG